VITATSLVDEAFASIRRHGLLRGGEVVLTAVSGGADSVALLDVLVALRAILRIDLVVLHVHHGLRPEADADAAFVRDLCASLAVPFRCDRVAVRREAAPAAAWGGMEAAARRARYAAFRAAARAVGASRVATAHTADDQAETVLMRLLHGAGPRGLGGIAPARGPYIRPLLGSRRMQVESHCRERGLPWVEDASNRDLAFLRNRLRHDVLPFLAEHLDADIVASLCRGAAVARWLLADLERQAEEALDRLARTSLIGLILAVDAMERLPGELAAEVLRRAASRMGPVPSLRGAGERALRRLLAGAARSRGLRLGAARVECSGGWLRVGPPVLVPLAAREWATPGTLPLPEIGASLEARLVLPSPRYAIPRGRDTVAFDADALPARLHVRARRRGDRVLPFGGRCERSLKSWLIDAKVPRWDRDRLPLVLAGDTVLWVAGLRRAAAAPVTADTRRILEVTLHSPLAGPGTGE
jgi:tRNA(Ile)-lysidine synthase